MSGTLRADLRDVGVALSNPDKVLYPAVRFTKAEVVGYYMAVAPFILPHLADRPVTLLRYPDGVNGKFFYEKHAPRFTPSWVRTVHVPRRRRGEPPINYVVIDDRRTLAWVANLASLELHPFLHRATALDTPTAVVFDLDPGEGADVLTCARVAFLLKDVLDRLKLAAFPKVSGSKGLQVYVPLNTPVTYAATQPFAQAMAELLEREHPALVIGDMAKHLRAGKVFIDWSQNAEHKTTVGAYSLRAKRERPFVSLPMTWQELQAALDGRDAGRLYHEPVAALERLATVGDLFAPLLSLAQELPVEFAERFTGRRPEPRRARPTAPAPSQAMPRRGRPGGRRRFVIHEHAAGGQRIGLELDDRLASWTVPDGIPHASREPRTATAAEDRPLDRLAVEAAPGRGEARDGATAWDVGTYAAVEGSVADGRLRIALNGKKLRGEWLLERRPGKGDAAWSVTRLGRRMKAVPRAEARASAPTGRPLARTAGSADDKHPPRRASRGDSAGRRAPRRPAPGRRASVDLHGLPPADFQFVEPMQCELVARLPEGPAWQYEVKYDGYRALALRAGDRVRLLSRRGNDLRRRFPELVGALDTLPEGCMLDGEVVALDDAGRLSFQLLHRTDTPAARIAYFAFDVLASEGRSVQGLPLGDRRVLLESILAHVRDPIRLSARFDAPPRDLVAAAKELGFEGVVAKRADSVYEPGRRSGAWVKQRIGSGQELVIGGYVPGPRHFDALLVGYYEGARLLFVGKVRNGFVPAVREQLAARFEQLETPACPFANLPEPKSARRGVALTRDVMRQCRWLEPELVAQVEFTEWTPNDHLRHARFLGLREDKDAREVTRETARP